MASKNKFYIGMNKFEQTTPQSEIQGVGYALETHPSRKSVLVEFGNLSLNAENPRSPEVTVVFEKQPIDVVEDKSYGTWAVLIDKETEGMRRLASEAEALLVLPEIERPAKVLEILRRNTHYAYDDVIQDLSKRDPERARWVSENTGLRASVINVPLSQVLERGYGVCRHLAVAYLWLAQKAGLKGVILNSDLIKNILRTDTNTKLFRSVDIGQTVPPHVWVEIKTSDGRWIPIDPSTRIVGDTEEGLEMFRAANYKAYYSLRFAAEPPDKLSVDGTFIPFAPGEATSSGTFCLELKSTKPTTFVNSNRSVNKIPPTNVPYSGEGKLKIYIEYEEVWGMALDIVQVE